MLFCGLMKIKISGIIPDILYLLNNICRYISPRLLLLQELIFFGFLGATGTVYLKEMVT